MEAILPILLFFNSGYQGGHHPVEDMVDVAEALERHCMVWHGPEEQCHLLMSAIYFKETRITAVPNRNGTGCGIGQVIPQKRRVCRRAKKAKRAKVRRALYHKGWCHRPTCDDLEVLTIGVEASIKIANGIYKSWCRRSRTPFQCIATIYNGSKRKKQYGRDVAYFIRKYRRHVRRQERKK